MTKKELYEKVKAGAEYGHRIESINSTTVALWRLGKYIYFQHYGRTASRANYKDFADTFSAMFGTVREFLKENHELFIDYGSYKDRINKSGI